MNRNHVAFRLLAVAIGATMVAFGADQIRYPHRWTHYIPDWLARLLPVSRPGAMRAHGTGNVSLGLALVVFSPAQLTWILAAGWWACVTPLCGRVDWRAGARDATILAAILAVIMLRRSGDG